jgi:hypothetical protein
LDGKFHCLLFFPLSIEEFAGILVPDIFFDVLFMFVVRGQIFNRDQGKIARTNRGGISIRTDQIEI